MESKAVSQKTMVEVMRALREHGDSGNEMSAPPNFTELLYERNFPEWFIKNLHREYQWNWTRALMDMRHGRFFYSRYTGESITGKYLSDISARELGERLVQRLAAFATTLPTGEPVLRSLQLDGFDVNTDKLVLVPMEGPVRPQEEEDRLTALVNRSGLPNIALILKHINDAHSLYVDGKNHPSLNESRSLIQTVIDQISTETHEHGGHTAKLPGGTANRINYLTEVGFLVPDEKTSLDSGWGSLSAGSHPGVPERELARIGLVLALEFGQLLILKFANWKSNAYRAFS